MENVLNKNCKNKKKLMTSVGRLNLFKANLDFFFGNSNKKYWYFKKKMFKSWFK